MISPSSRCRISSLCFIDHFGEIKHFQIKIVIFSLLFGDAFREHIIEENVLSDN